ncbi:MAG TPA: hypothetical protein VEV45_21105 [Streptosporangiaceae bacterium]|nr:hypothetical protein [Streptosporangiaceae bacterium]
MADQEQERPVGARLVEALQALAHRVGQALARWAADLWEGLRQVAAHLGAGRPVGWPADPVGSWGLWQVVPVTVCPEHLAAALQAADLGLAEVGQRWAVAARQAAQAMEPRPGLGALLSAGSMDQYRSPGGRPDPGAHP